MAVQWWERAVEYVFVLSLINTNHKDSGLGFLQELQLITRRAAWLPL